MSKGSWSDRLRKYDAGMAITLAFFVVSVATLPDYGQTWDEAETSDAAFLDLRMVRAFVTGQAKPSWEGHELPGYYFVLDSLRGGFAWVARRLHVLDDVLSIHFVQILLATLSVLLFYRLAENLSGGRRIAVLSTMVLVLFPQFLAHSQNNPKDLPGLFVFVLAIYTFTRLARPEGDGGRLRDVLYAGLALGLALTTHVSAVFLVPVLGIWQLATRRVVRWRSQLLVLGVAGTTAFLTWPWLWSAPGKNLVWAARHIAARLHNDYIRVLYLGRIYNAWEVPWHYSLVLLLATTPVLYLVFALFGVSPFRSRADRTAAGGRSAVILGCLWCAILIAAETRAPMRYDGVRHLLMIVPGFCLVAGVGLDRILRWIEETSMVARSGTLRRIAAPACAGLMFASVGVELIRMHPYHNAYLNEAANAWLPGNAEDVFEVEYWQQSYKEGAEWLNAHAEPDAGIFVAFDDRCADHYLRRKATELDSTNLPLFEDRMRVAYLMVMTRKAMYKDAVAHVVRAYEPVFTIRRQKGTLLRLYSNRRPRIDSGS